ncbi:hypothetical protein Tco_0534321 [Tanacetum coccineum]
MMREWMANQIEGNVDMKNQVSSESLPHTKYAKQPSIQNENDKGDVETIEENEIKPIPTMPNLKSIMSTSPTVSPFITDCTVHIPYTNAKMFANDVLMNHVGDEKLNEIDGVGNGWMTKKEKDDNGVPKEPNKEWKLNDKAVPYNTNDDDNSGTTSIEENNTHPEGNDDDNSGTTSIEENNTHLEGIVSNEIDLVGDFYKNSEFNSESADLPVNIVRRFSRQTKLPTSLNDFMIDGYSDREASFSLEELLGAFLESESPLEEVEKDLDHHDVSYETESMLHEVHHFFHIAWILQELRRELYDPDAICRSYF